MTVVWAGPFGAALLSDMGAEVIRVESAQRWDTIIRMAGDAKAMRDHGSDVPLDAPPWEISSNWNTVGRNRKSVTMDLSRPEGREVFYRLVSKSDIFIENNSPDVVHHLKIDYETLRAAQPEADHGVAVGLRRYRALPQLPRLRLQHGGGRRPCAAAWLYRHGPHAQHQRLLRRRLRRRHVCFRHAGGAATTATSRARASTSTCRSRRTWRTR